MTRSGWRWLGLGGAALAASTTAVWFGCGSDSGPTGGAPPGGGSTGATTGAGCLATLPASLPYTPGCCDYAVAIPEVTESGFDDGKVTGAPPDHVHVGLAGPTETSFVVGWRSDRDATATQLLYGTDQAKVAAADGPSDGVERVTGHHVLYGSVLDGASLTRAHEVHVCGLLPATRYYYKVGGPGGWSAVADVSTGPPIGTGDHLRIAVLGDSRSDPGVLAKIEARLDDEDIALQLLTGDAVAIGAQQQSWDELFEAESGGKSVAQVLARTAAMPVNGNHENLALNYFVQFAMPQELTESEGAQGEEWYSFDYGNAHIVALNDTPEAAVTDGSQLAWLEADLGSVDRKLTPWLLVMHHRSIYCCGGSHHSDLELRHALQPLFDKHGVDLVFSGHDHLYERSKPIRGLDGDDGILAAAGPDDTPIDGSGTLYVVTGGAGAPLYDADDSCAHTHLSESTNNYVIIDITGNDLAYAAHRADGSVIEELAIAK